MELNDVKVSSASDRDLFVSFELAVSGKQITHADLIEILATLTIKNVFGTGIDRRKALGSLYSEVQRKVNTML